MISCDYSADMVVVECMLLLICQVICDINGAMI